MSGAESVQPGMQTQSMPTLGTLRARLGNAWNHFSFFNPRIEATLSTVAAWTKTVTLFDTVTVVSRFWPIPLIAIGQRILGWILPYWVSASTTHAAALFVPSMVLVLLRVGRELRRCKTLSVLSGAVYSAWVLCQAIEDFGGFLVTHCPQRSIGRWISSTLGANALLLTALMTLTMGIIVTTRYLWLRCGFKTLFSAPPWTRINRPSIVANAMHAIAHGWSRRSHTLVTQSVQTGCAALVGGWPCLVLYALFFKADFIQASLAPLPHRSLWIAMMPIMTAVLAVALHGLKRGRSLSVALAILVNMLVGIDNSLKLIAAIRRACPTPTLLGLIEALGALDLLRVVLALLPFAAALLSARYLGSHAEVGDRLKSSGLKTDNPFGSAKFADLPAIRKLNYEAGFVVGAIPTIADFTRVESVLDSIQKRKGGDLIRLKAVHATIVAPSGSGKGVGIVIPTLLEYPGPVFVTDIKGENYTITQRARRAKGKSRQVIAFDPFHITQSPLVRINPLDLLNPEQECVVDDAQTLASLICPVYDQDGTNASYFQSQGATAIQCLLLYIACSPEVPKEQKNLAKIYELLCLPNNDFIEFLSKIGGDTLLAYGTAQHLANRLAGTDPRELSGVLNSAFKEMKFISLPSVQKATACSDIDLSQIPHGNLDLFVCIPPDRLENQSRLLRLLTGMTFLHMQKAQGNRGPHSLLMVLDEMPALGHLKQIEQVQDYGRGYGVSLMAISQTIEAIERVYPKSWKTFFANQLSVFFGCSESSTSKFVSEKIGQTTIKTRSVNNSAGSQMRSMEWLGTSSTQVSDTEAQAGRALLMKEEVEKLGNRVVLAFFRDDASSDPILCQRIDYRERAEWNGLWDENPLHISGPGATHNPVGWREYGRLVRAVLMG